MRVLLTGSKGQLGSCFKDRLPNEWKIWATDAELLDITDITAVKAAVEKFQPDCIVNAAAYTAVDKAESESELAYMINVVGPRNLALVARKFSLRLVHVSTDYVFDGKSQKPYVETDIPHPLGVYGQTKLEGEVAVVQVYPEAIILRTAWVFSEYGNNFVKTMLRLASVHNVLNIVADQRGCPTYAGDIALAIIELLQNNAEGGVYHYCGDEGTTWDKFAGQIFLNAQILKKLDKLPIINAITSREFPTVASRPYYSILDTAKIGKYNIKASDWHAALFNVIAKI